MKHKTLTWIAMSTLFGLVLLINPGSTIVGQENDAVEQVVWEYEVKSLSGSQYDYEAKLNEMGSEGWELVTASPNRQKFKESHVLFVFKRPVR